MYFHRHDAEEGLAIWAFSSPSGSDWDAHFVHLREVTRWSPRLKRRAACILLTGKDFDRPDAKRRQELAQLTDAPGYDPYVAFVSPNAAVRAVLTMFKWVQKAPRYEMDFFATSAEGIEWLAKKRGGRLVALERMLREVEREMAAPAGRTRANL